MRARIAHALRPWRRANPGARGLVIAGLLITFAFGFMAVFADTVAPYGQSQYCADEFFDPSVGESGVCIAAPEENPRREAPSAAHPFGTTDNRFDVLSRVILGSRLAFAVVACSTLFAMLIGVPLGLFSGYIGGRLDRALVLVMDTIYAFPSLLLAILIAFALRLRLEQLGIDAAGGGWSPATEPTGEASAPDEGGTPQAGTA